jgi:hypothetical protein
VNTREEWHWSHACKSFKRSKGVKLNGILESVNIRRKTRTVQQPQLIMMLTLTQQNPWLKTRTVQQLLLPVLRIPLLLVLLLVLLLQRFLPFVRLQPRPSVQSARWRQGSWSVRRSILEE